MDYDIAVIGGSYAGLSAAIYAARGRRSVAVIDAGRPRNRFSPESHGFFGQDGATGAAMLARARADLARYPAVELIAGTATAATADDGLFMVSVADRAPIRVAKLILATGINDILPDVPGLAERWGVGVLHCPYCHGYEHAGRPLGVLGQSEGALHHARLIANWGPTTLFLDAGIAADDATLAGLRETGVRVERERIVELHGSGRELSSIELASGEHVPAVALFVMPGLQLASPIAEHLGCELVDAPTGRIVKVDGAMRTSVPSVYACGDAARAFGNAMLAAADGVIAGGSANYASIFGEPAR
ncbi:NAD(P)/FAD-dependent oxidoreductase [Sphingomonas sp.]|uniref:NAD(P)/FAD-dependent oxidoreductase n=1 Tax=Sphingomonas sp. TaxID=28214 RepID=UPI0035C849DA